MDMSLTTTCLAYLILTCQNVTKKRMVNSSLKLNREEIIYFRCLFASSLTQKEDAERHDEA